MTSPAASGGIRTGIRCTTAQPISTRQGCVARNANAWIRGPGSLEKRAGPGRYMRRGLAGVAVLRTLAHPAAEFYLCVRKVPGATAEGHRATVARLQPSRHLSGTPPFNYLEDQRP